MPLSAPAPRASSKQIRISTLETERGREAILGLVKTGHSQRTGCLLEGCLCSLIPLDSICREEGRNSRRRTRRIKKGAGFPYSGRATLSITSYFRSFEQFNLCVCLGNYSGCSMFFHAEHRLPVRKFLRELFSAKRDHFLLHFPLVRPLPFKFFGSCPIMPVWVSDSSPAGALSMSSYHVR